MRGYARLANEIQQTDSVVRQIKAAMNEQQEGSSKITSALRDMTDSASQVRDSSKKMADESGAIMEQVSSLREKTESMKRSMEQMNKNAEKIKSAGNSLSEISDVMERSIGEIGAQIDQFRV